VRVLVRGRFAQGGRGPACHYIVIIEYSGFAQAIEAFNPK
jgi:hypothetical protein